MEIVGLAFVGGLVLHFLEAAERRRLFPPAPCKWCPMIVHLEGDIWIHEDGSQYAEWPGLDYDIEGLVPPPLHPAIPLSTGGFQ